MEQFNIEWKDIASVKPYARNAKKHDETQVANVAESIKQFGWQQPIVCDKDGVIIIGHCRILAAKKLGLKKVPVKTVNNLSEEQVKKLRNLDNKLNESDWDFDLLAEDIDGLDFSGFDIDWGLPADEEETEIVEDEPPEVDEENEPICKLGDIWQLGEHRLMCGDSTDRATVEKLMNGEKAFLCVTDPPYNTNNGAKDELLAEFRPNERVKKTDKVHLINDNMSTDAFCLFLKNVFENMRDNLVMGGAFYIWHAFRSQREFENALNDVGLYVRQQLIWVKNHFSLGMQDYEWKHELCFYGWTNGTHYFVDDRTQTTVYEDQIDFKKLKKDEMLKLLEQIYSDKISTTVLKEDKPMRNALHPTMKPIKLLATQIRNSSKKSDIVLDLFGGSGSTLIACEQLNRRCYMLELSPKYCDVIIRRWENLTGKKAVKIS